MKPTLQELREAAMSGGQLPESYFKRTGIKPDNVESKPRGVEIIDPTEEVEIDPNKKEPEETSEWPKERTRGWWELSSGKKIQNEEKARQAQAKLDG